jgi:uncharacterized membrane protein affecting hemolysin expression
VAIVATGWTLASVRAKRKRARMSSGLFVLPVALDVRLIIEDVTLETKEFRATVYDYDGQIIAESWAETPKAAALIVLGDIYA